MATTLHPNSVIGLFNAMGTPLLIFAVNGKVTFANSAAKIHPSNPTVALNGNPTIRTVVSEIFTGKIALPHGEHIKTQGQTISCRFMQGLSGNDVACVVTGYSGEVHQTDRFAKLENILEQLRVDLMTPMSKLNTQLRTYYEEDRSNTDDSEPPAIAAINTLFDRMKRLYELVSVFGDDLAGAFDRVDVFATLNRVLAEMMPAAIRTKVDFDLVFPDYKLPPIYGSPVMIRRALFESIDQAIKDARKEVDPKAEVVVQIRLTLQGQYLMIFVKSKGAKVAEAKEKIELKKLRVLNLLVSDDVAFQFKKVEKLGLPLIERIVSLHGGAMRKQNADGDAVELMIELPTGEPRRNNNVALMQEQLKIFADELKRLKGRREATA
jgi:hypothetical protein